MFSDPARAVTASPNLKPLFYPRQVSLFLGEYDRWIFLLPGIVATMTDA
jgi:hypothetical protein